MKFIGALFWSFLLVQMATYVVGSMSAATYDFNIGLTLWVALSVVIFGITALIPNDPVPTNHH